MGSLCCVAARPHGSSAPSGEWSIGPNDPYWRNNTSFSPPPSRWDFRFQPEGLSFGSHDGIQLYGSSASSNSRGSRSWVRGNRLSNHQHSISDGVGPYYSSPSEISPVQQWTPPTIQEIRVDDCGTSSRRVLGQLSFTPTMEGTSAVQDSGGSTSSRSDSSDYEPMTKSHLSSHRNPSSRRCFMSKPIHPLSFPSETHTREAADATAAGFSAFDAATPHRETHRLSSASGSIDFTDVSEPLESDSSGRSSNPSEGVKCGLCERFLSQRSPWSSRRIMKSGDMPVAGVLSCRHVFHAECLEQTTPKTGKNDPPCPLCIRSEDENSLEHRVYSKMRNGFPKLRPFREDGPSKPWGCAQAGDCVESALHAPSRNTLSLLNRNRIRKNLSLKGNSGQEFPGKLRKISSHSSPLIIGRSADQGAVGSSKSTAGPST
ncbi:RING finger protein [Actinidia chinensis var. chinensis]|uniref:RING finger protein n=1 Tax=Actinidia chinensis var. chinensis TaxID=1590841 RepID=A0A2R6RFE7_ACTCC|nr:RING finger protein [Actinidia chinensis var. chinensis]